MERRGLSLARIASLISSRISLFCICPPWARAAHRRWLKTKGYLPRIRQQDGRLGVVDAKCGCFYDTGSPEQRYGMLCLVRASPSGKAPASQAGIRGFESRCPLHRTSNGRHPQGCRPFFCTPWYTLCCTLARKRKQARRFTPSDLHFCNGGPCGGRTHDLGIKSPLLCQLS